MTLLMGPRVEGWRLDAITPDGEHIATLPLIRDSGRHDWAMDKANPLGMTCRIGGVMPDGSPLPDLRGVWLRGTYRCNGAEHILGTWVLARRPRKLTRYDATLTLTGVDPTAVLSRTRLRQTIAYPAGTPIAETAQGLIATYAPSLRAAVGDTDETLPTSLGFDAGTTVLDVCNKLLEVAVYRPLSPDRLGNVLAERWAAYDQRPTVGTFGRDDYSLRFQPEVDADDNELGRPDQIIARGKGGQDAAPVEAMWPEYAIPDAITETITGDYADAAAAALAARRRWSEAQARSLTAPLTGPWQPVEPGDILGWTWPRHGVDIRAELTGLATQWVLSSPTVYQLREVPL